MVERRVVEYSIPSSKESIFILVGDIGGTNTNFGVFALENSAELLISLHYKSKLISDFNAVVLDAIVHIKDVYDICVLKIVIAAAGVVSENADFVKPTNLPFLINKGAIIKNTGIASVELVNDFLVIGYGLDVLNPSSVISIQKGLPRTHANKAIIGAGTGLGKSLMIWDANLARYESISSEGGHGDCAVQTEVEFNCISYIKKHQGQQKKAVSWEDILSGDGIRAMYTFFHAQDGMRYKGDEQSPHPDEIFNNRNRSESCQQTVQMYTKMYARCAKNYALDTLALSGIYIAGGIASKNIPLFQSKLFLEEFVYCDKHQDLLAQVPIYVIADYNVSLYGAAEYLRLRSRSW